MLRRKKDDVLKDLPPILHTQVVVEPSPVDLSLWFPRIEYGWDSEREVLAKIDQENQVLESIFQLKGETTDAAEILKGFQNSPKVVVSRRYVGLQKATTVAELIGDELRSNLIDKIVVFAWHRDVLKQMWLCLHEEFKADIIYGGSNPRKRDRMVHRFQTDPKHRVLLAQILACGIAIDLHAACEAAFVECSYVPSDNAQAAMRLHRIGQQRRVRIRYFSLDHHVDESVMAICRRKTKDLTAIFDPVAPEPAVVPNPFAEE